MLKGDDMANIEYMETDGQGLDLTVSLRQKLIDYHKANAPDYFYQRYAEMDVLRSTELMLEKFGKESIRVDLARDTETGELVGYCISTISGDKQGEIASIYVEPDYRRAGIGDNFMKKALRWMDERSVLKKVLGVGAGNEAVFAFYSRYNFYPRAYILEQVEAGEEK